MKGRLADEAPGGAAAALQGGGRGEALSEGHDPPRDVNLRRAPRLRGWETITEAEKATS